MQIKVALAGQPNCGKSTVFNMISGIRQHIANYPGVTVDKKSGFFSVGDVGVEMVDLPGTYSFSSYSLEEKVAKEFIINEKPDLILNIVDASNLKRNLYLTFQLLEIGVPVVVVLNMFDVAKRRGIIIDAQKIGEILRCPVICASASKSEGKAEILDVLRSAGKLKQNYEEFKINYGELEPFISRLQDSVSLDGGGISKRWLCIKALENDTSALNLLKKNNADAEKLATEQRAKFNEKFGRSVENFWRRCDTKTPKSSFASARGRLKKANDANG